MNTLGYIDRYSISLIPYINLSWDDGEFSISIGWLSAAFYIWWDNGK
jgi:hypothetical protein